MSFHISNSGIILWIVLLWKVRHERQRQRTNSRLNTHETKVSISCTCRQTVVLHIYFILLLLKCLILKLGIRFDFFLLLQHYEMNTLSFFFYHKERERFATFISKAPVASKRDIYCTMVKKYASILICFFPCNKTGYDRIFKSLTTGKTSIAEFVKVANSK